MGQECCGRRGARLAPDHAAGLAAAGGGGRDEVTVAVRLAGVDPVGTGDRPHLDAGHIGQAEAVFPLREQQVARTFRKVAVHPGRVFKEVIEVVALADSGPRRVVRQVVQFVAPDQAVGHCVGEHAGVTQFDGMGDGALFEELAIEGAGAGGLEEIPRGDEDQLAARRQMAYAFFDEKKIQVAAPVKTVLAQQRPGRCADVLVAHVGRVADHRVEFFALRIGKKILVERAGRALTRVHFDAHCMMQAVQEGPVAAGGLEHPPGVVAQAKHGAHDPFGGEHLAESGKVGQQGGGGGGGRHGVGKRGGPTIVQEVG